MYAIPHPQHTHTHTHTHKEREKEKGTVREGSEKKKRGLQTCITDAIIALLTMQLF